MAYKKGYLFHSDGVLILYNIFMASNLVLMPPNQTIRPMKLVHVLGLGVGMRFCR